MMALQVAILLYLCQVLVYSMWARGTDPDNAAIPYLTAIGDLLGTGLLAASFLGLHVVRDGFLEDIEDVMETMENVTGVYIGN